MNTNTNAELLLVERYLLLGMLGKALSLLAEHKIQTKPIQAFIACGDACVKKEQWKTAFEAYKKADAVWKLIELGDVCLTTGNLRQAFDAYSAAKAGLQLTKLGKHALKQKKLDVAFDCYGEISDRNGLIAVGKTAEKEADIPLAIKAYTKAETIQELIAVGMEALRRFEERPDSSNFICHAKDAFLAAKAPEHLKLCGDAYLTLLSKQPQYETDAFNWAIEMYQKAKAPLPVESLLAIVDGWLLPCGAGFEAAERACHKLCDAGIVPTSIV